MIFAIYLAITTLLATITTLTFPNGVHLILRSHLCSISSPANVGGLYTHPTTQPVRPTLEASTKSLSAYPLLDITEVLHHDGGLATDSVIPSALILSSKASQAPESNLTHLMILSLSALLCLFIAVYSIRKSTSLLGFAASADERPPAVAASDENEPPLAKYLIGFTRNPSAVEFKQTIPPEIEFERCVKDVSDIDAAYTQSWKVPGGHFTVFYIPEMPDDHPDATRDFYAEVAVDKYEFAVQRILPSESATKAMETTHNNTTQSTITTTESTTVPASCSITINNVIALPAAENNPDILSILTSIPPFLYEPSTSPTSTEQELTHLLSTIPISVPEDLFDEPDSDAIPLPSPSCSFNLPPRPSPETNASNLPGPPFTPTPRLPLERSPRAFSSFESGAPTWGYARLRVASNIGRDAREEIEAVPIGQIEVCYSPSKGTLRICN
jgi:hypothetical protein